MAENFDMPDGFDEDMYQTLRKSGLIPMTESSRSKKRVIGHFKDVHYVKNINDMDTSHFQQLLTKIMGSKKQTIHKMPNQSLTIGGIPIWRQAQSFGNNFFENGSVSSYPSISVQDTITKFQQALKMTSNTKGGRKAFYSLDIETMGDSASQMEHISEIALPKFQYDPSVKKYIPQANISFLLAPDESFTKYLKELIQKAEKNPQGFLALNESERHSLTSLIRYSNEAVTLNGHTYSGAKLSELATNQGRMKQFGGIRKGQFEIKHHEIIDLIQPDNKMDLKIIQSNLPQLIRLMKTGLSNLQKKGIQNTGKDIKGHQKVLESINQFLGQHAIDPKTNRAESFFITMNGDKFDIPYMERFFAKNNVTLSKDFLHLDLQRLMDHMMPYNMKLHEALRRDKNLIFASGPLSLQEIIKTLNLGQMSSHAALSDAIATGDVYLSVEKMLENWMNKANQSTQVGKSKSKKQNQILSQRGKQMEFNPLPIGKNDILFAKNAVSINLKRNDFQAEFVNGQFRVSSDSFNRMVINAESFYQIGSVRDLSKDNNKHFVLELINTENNARSFISREGQAAEQEIMDYIHRHFTVMDSKDFSHQKMKIDTKEINLLDKARRMYDSMFELSESQTKGLQGAYRLFQNASILKNQYGTEIQNILSIADAYEKSLGKKMMKGDKVVARSSLVADLLEDLIKKEKINLDFNSIWQSESGNGKKGKYVFNQMEKKKFLMIYERLAAESDLFLPAIQHLMTAVDPKTKKKIYGDESVRSSGSGIKFHRKQADAFLQYARLVNDQLGEERVKRKALPFESYLFEFEDRISGDFVGIDLYDHNRAKQSIYQYMRKLDPYLKSKLEEQAGDPKAIHELNMKRTRIEQERVASLLASLAQKTFITTNDAARLNEQILTGQMTSFELSSQLAHQMMNATQISRKEIEEVSMAVRKGTSAINQEKISEMIKQMDQFSSSLIGNLSRNKSPIYSDSITDYLSKLDESHKINGIEYLAPNHRRALDRLLSEIDSVAGPAYQINGKQVNIKPHISVQMNDEGTDLILNIYREEHADRVRSMLTRGATIAQNQAIQLNLPVISSKGVMAYGNRMLNAQMHLIMDKGKFMNVSSFEKMVMQLVEGGSIKRMMYHLRDNRIEDANSFIKSRMNESLEDLAGVRRDPFSGKSPSMSDTRMYRGSESDYLKQFIQNLESGIIHHFHREKPDEFGRNAFFDSAYVNVNGKDVLRTFVSMDDVKFNKREELIYAMSDWIGKGESALPGMNFDGLRPLMRDMYWSGVKSTHAGSGLSAVDMRSLIPFGHMYGMQKDNPIQFFNRHPLKENFFQLVEQNQILKRSIFENKNMIETPNLIAMRNLNADMVESKFYGRVMLMSQTQLEERVRDLLFSPQYNDQQRKTHLSLLQTHDLVNEKGQINPRNVLSLYEHQIMVSDQLMKTIRYDYQKQISVNSSFVWDEKIASKNKKGNYHFLETIIQPGQLLGHEMIYGEKKPIYFDERFEGTIVSDVQDSKIQIRAERMPSKFMIGPEKGTLAGGAPAGVSHDVMRMIAGRDDVIAFVNPNLRKNQYEASVFEGMFNELTLFSKTLSSNQLKDLEKMTRTSLIDNAKIEGLGVKIQNNQLRFIDFGIKNISVIKDEAGNVLNNQVDQLMNFFENVDQRFGSQMMPKVKGTMTGVFPIIMSHVDDYSAIAMEQSKKSLSIDPQFMNVIKNKGLTQTYRNLVAQIAREASRGEFKGDRATMRNQAIGLVSALDYLQNGTAPPERVTLQQSMSALDFMNEPTIDRSSFHFARTIHDSDYIRETLGLNQRTHAGFFMKLPDAELNGQAPFTDQNGKAIDKVFIPFIKNNGHDGNWYLKPLQKEIENLKQRAAEVEKDSTNPKNITELQDALQKYHKQLVYDITSSSGYLQENAFRIKAPKSSRGLAKIAPITESAPIVEKFGQYVMLSKSMAKELGVLDQIIDSSRADQNRYYANLENQKEFFTLVPRPPYYSEHAIQHARVFVDMNDTSGLSHTMDALTGKNLMADSDGDFVSYMISHAKGTQSELKGYASRQNEALNMRYQPLYQNQVSAGVFDPKQKSLSLFAYEQELNKAMQDDATRSFDPREMAIKEDAKGILQNVGFDASEINSTAEKSAKIGKDYVGMVHNLNRAVKAVARSYATTMDGFDDIQTFMDSLEQKLTISAKNTYRDQSSRVFKSGIYDMFQAVRRFDFNEAAAIDEQYLGGKFTSEYRLKEAGVAVHSMLQNMYGSKANQVSMSDLFQDFPHLKVGTSRGIMLDGTQNIQQRVSKALDVLLLRDATTAAEGLNPMEVGNTSVDLLHHVMGSGKHMPAHGPAFSKAMQAEREQIAIDSTKEINSLKGLLNDYRGTQTTAWMSDLTGGMLPEEKIGKYIQKLPSNWKRWSLGVAGAIAIGNNFSASAPNPMMTAPNPQKALGAEGNYGPLIGGQLGSAGLPSQTISISAKGRSMNGNDLTSIIRNTFNQSPYSNERLNVSTIVRDGSKKINRDWLERKFSEYVD